MSALAHDLRLVAVASGVIDRLDGVERDAVRPERHPLHRHDDAVFDKLEKAALLVCRQARHESLDSALGPQPGRFEQSVERNVRRRRAPLVKTDLVGNARRKNRPMNGARRAVNETQTLKGDQGLAVAERQT